MESEVVIDWIGGNCPVQAEGTVAGQPFYFRARGCWWSFEVGPQGATGQNWAALWQYQEPYGDDPYDAGWMPEEDALRFIQEAAKRYLKEKADG
jgi:hypothetical protein